MVQHTRVVLRRAHRTEAFALGPHLAAAAFVLLGWGEPLKRWTGG